MNASSCSSAASLTLNRRVERRQKNKPSLAKTQAGSQQKRRPLSDKATNALQEVAALGLLVLAVLSPLAP